MLVTSVLVAISGCICCCLFTIGWRAYVRLRERQAVLLFDVEDALRDEMRTAGLTHLVTTYSSVPHKDKCVPA